MPTRDSINPRSRPTIVIELLATLEPGDVASYKALAEVLELREPEDRVRIQAAVRAAIPRLEKGWSRTVDAIPNTGYRVVFPDEHVPLADRHASKAGRSTGRAVAKVRYVDLNKVSPGLRPLVVDMVTRFDSLSSRIEDIGREKRAFEARLRAFERENGGDVDSGERP